jgi:hypothetical protein
VEHQNRHGVLALREERREMDGVRVSGPGALVRSWVLVLDLGREIGERVDFLLDLTPVDAGISFCSRSCLNGALTEMMIRMTYQSNDSHCFFAFFSHSFVMPYFLSCCTPSYVVGPTFDSFRSCLNSTSCSSGTETMNGLGFTKAFEGTVPKGADMVQ